MKLIIQSVGFILFFLFVSNKVISQARLTINNNSMRLMTLKVMKGGGERGTLYQTVTIGAYGNETIYFSEGGYYFTKTKAVLKGKDPVYQKGQPFKVTNDDTGYSVLTLTFTIKESSVPQVTGGKKISKEEFDKN